MGYVAESDWKLFRKRLPEWQESYMEKLAGEYTGILSGKGLASERFWALEKRGNEDKRCPGVMASGVSCSTMHYEIARLTLAGAITLDNFNEDVRRYVQRRLE